MLAGYVKTWIRYIENDAFAIFSIKGNFKVLIALDSRVISPKIKTPEKKAALLKNRFKNILNNSNRKIFLLFFLGKISKFSKKIPIPTKKHEIFFVNIELIKLQNNNETAIKIEKKAHLDNLSKFFDIEEKEI